MIRVETRTNQIAQINGPQYKRYSLGGMKGRGENSVRCSKTVEDRRQKTFFPGFENTLNTSNIFRKIWGARTDENTSFSFLLGPLTVKECC